jgi:hypothetical protein
MALNRSAIIALVSISAGVALVFGLHPYLMDMYMAHSPRLPVDATGQVHPYFQHGVTVYLSIKQMAVLGTVLIAGLGALLMAGVALKAWLLPASGK